MIWNKRAAFFCFICIHHVYVYVVGVQRVGVCVFIFCIVCASFALLKQSNNDLNNNQNQNEEQSETIETVSEQNIEGKKIDMRGREMYVSK